MKTLLVLCALALTGCVTARPTSTLPPSITFNSDLTSGAGTVAVKLTWATTPPASSCTASGAWTGSKAAAGTEQQPSITTSATYILSCSWQGDGLATLSWTAPTLNTDGSALTDLTGYTINRKVDNGEFGLYRTINDPTILVLVDSLLAPGVYSYTVNAVNSSNVSSDPSNVASKTITSTTSTTEQIAITVNPKPSPPTTLTAQ